MNEIKALVDYFYNLEFNSLSKTEEKYYKCCLSVNLIIKQIKDKKFKKMPINHKCDIYALFENKIFWENFFSKMKYIFSWRAV